MALGGMHHPGVRLARLFNESLLKPFQEPQYPNQDKLLLPLPEVIDQDLEYEVDKMLNLKLVQGKLKYLVKWKGYWNEENSWEPTEYPLLTELHRFGLQACP
jgi:hypothetical protein